MAVPEAFPNTNVIASLASIGYGAAFSLGVGILPAAAVYTQVVEVSDVDWSGITVGKEDVTNLGSPGGFKEYIPGLSDAGTMTVEGNWIGGDATLAAVQASVFARTIQCFQIQALSNAKTKTTTVQGLGFITKFNPLGKVTADKAVKYALDIQLSGLPLLTEV